MKQDIISLIFDKKGKTLPNVILDIISAVLFFATFLSIPLFSFKTGFTYITWFFSVALFLIMMINLLFYYKIRIDLITISLSLFLISALFSSLITGFHGFRFTPLLLNVACIILYTYCASNRSAIKPLLYSSYCSTIVFIIIFIIEYRQDFFSFNGARLGTAFGDQNDISIFLSLAYSFSIYYLLFSRPLANTLFYKTLFVILKPIYFLAAVASVLCGALCGSKIFILLIIFATLFVVIAFFGKKRWYLSFIVLLLMMFVLIFILSLPLFSMIKERVLSFISTIFGVDMGLTNSTDGSTIERLNLLVLSLKMFLQKPIFGYGVNVRLLCERW